ncbi:MAG TPA: hypothetical protein VJK51_00615 [Candidatus Nanoarchaeia archaeon]|nr:hypothetical protein [Candidatus Nanoarchaeia archaeon]
MIDLESLEEVKEALKGEPTPKIIQARSGEYNRKLLEQYSFNILLFPAKTRKKESLRQLDLSFNHVLAKIAAKKKIALGIDLKSLRKEKESELDRELSILKELIALARTHKIPIKILNAKDKRNAQSLLLTLGASTQQAKQAISF